MDCKIVAVARSDKLEKNQVITTCYVKKTENWELETGKSAIILIF
jgi:hypothetical protein